MQDTSRKAQLTTSTANHFHSVGGSGWTLVIDLDPLLFATVTRGLTGGLDASFKGESFFRGAAEGLAGSLLDTISFNNVIDGTITSSDPVTYSVEIINFNRGVEEGGIGEAMKDRLSGIMFRDTVESLSAPDGLLKKMTSAINDVIKEALNPVGEIDVIDENTIQYRNK